jgi:flagellar biosynthesis/type III secretory pathway protein FliH
MSRDNISFTPFKPAELIEGVTIDEIKKIPSVQALVDEHIKKELDRSYKIGHAEGLELGRKEGKEQSYVDAYKDYKADFDVLFAEAKVQLSELIVQLKEPLMDCQKEAKASMIRSFNEVIVEFVSNPEIYEDKLVGCIDNLINVLPENKRELTVDVSSLVTDDFKSLLETFAINFKIVEMNDLFRVYSKTGNYRMNVAEFAKALM